ncbi:MAG: hypothetical protein AB7F43_13015 [Bacteriovoracia bacterium]
MRFDQIRWRILGMWLGYLMCFWFLRLIFLTIVTYSMVRTHEFIQKVGDFARSNLIPTYGIAALLFIGILHMLYPLSTTSVSKIFQISTFRKNFAQNAFSGTILGIVLVAVLLVSGHLQYLGVYVQMDELVFTFLSILFFSLSIILITIVEEYILRENIEKLVNYPLWVAPILSSFCFLVIKWNQFELHWVEALNFVLINLVCSRMRSYVSSSIFIFSFLLVLHILFGLPFLGLDIPGIILFHFVPSQVPVDSMTWIDWSSSRGPESNLIFTTLLIVYLYLPQFRSQKTKKLL